MKNPKNSNKKSKTKSKLSKRSMIIGAILLALTFGVYELGRYTQKWGETNELRAMKSQSLASTDLLGLKLVKAEQMGEGSLVGKTVSPNITRTFEAKNGDVEATKKQIIEYAESEGWVYDSTISHYGSWWGRKTVGKIDLGIIIRDSLGQDKSVEVKIL